MTENARFIVSTFEDTKRFAFFVSHINFLEVSFVDTKMEDDLPKWIATM